jgi:hypothetical protein
MFGLVRPAHPHPSQDILTSAILVGLLQYRLGHEGRADLARLRSRAINVSFACLASDDYFLAQNDTDHSPAHKLSKNTG